MPSEHYFYHPFRNPLLGFFIDGDTSSTNISKFTIDDIDMYYQPLEHPTVAFSVFLFKLLVISIGEVVSMKVLEVAKKETSIINQMTILFCITQMIFHPLLLLFDLTVNLIHPIDEVISPWLCHFGWFFYGMSTKIVLYNSFIIAVMRYLFIIYSKTAETYGKEKIKQYFIWLGVLIPLVGVILDGIDHKDLSRLSFINKCYGKDHKVFLIETSTLDVIKRKFWKIEDFVENDSWAIFLSMLHRILRIVKTVIYLIAGFNITEGILYYKLFSHLNR